MAIVGYKKMGWTKENKNRKWALLITFDTELERDCFEKIMDRVQEMTDLKYN